MLLHSGTWQFVRSHAEVRRAVAAALVNDFINPSPDLSSALTLAANLSAMRNRLLGAIAACSPFLFGLSGCGSEAGAASDLAGKVAVDGSSTVYPITEAVAEEFRGVHARVNVNVGVSGTGGGFKQFCIGSKDINDASRPIKQKEIAKAAENGIEFIELPVAYDGLTVVVNKQNDWVDHLTTDELKRIWEPESKVTNWQDVRAGFPDLKLKLYGPGVDSGTFDYFTKAINGVERACRKDFTMSEKDDVIVNGVAGDRGALGFFGYAYYANNTDKLIAVPVKSGSGAAVAPSLQTINDGTYKPLSRPIFIYVATAAAERPEVATFVDFYLDQAPQLVEQVGYVKLPTEVYAGARRRFAERVTGSVYQDAASKNKTLIELFR